jgi:hypothetical protein
MNLAQLEAFQSSSKRKDGGSAALGRYQFINPRLAYNLSGISPNAKFTPENQDKMAIAYLEKKRRGKEWLSGKISNREYIEDLSNEWGAFRSYSGNVLPGNSGKIGPERIDAALNKVKEKYKGEREQARIRQVNPQAAGAQGPPAPGAVGTGVAPSPRASAAPFTGSTGSRTPSVASKPSAPVTPVAMSPELRDDTPFRSVGGGSSTVALAASNETQTQYVFVGGSKNEGITPREIQRLMLNA